MVKLSMLIAAQAEEARHDATVEGYATSDPEYSPEWMTRADVFQLVANVLDELADRVRAQEGQEW